MKKTIDLLKKLDKGEIVTISGCRFIKRDDNTIGTIFLETEEDLISSDCEISLNDFIKLCEEEK